MSRVERIGLATLYLGDCRDVIPLLEEGIDAVITDPPYGINAARDRKSEKWGWKDYPESGWDKMRPDADCFRIVLAAAPLQVIWGGNYFTDLIPQSHLSKWLIWDKGQEGFSLADAELAWCSFPGAIRRIKYHRARALQDGKEHSTQKPVEVMKWTILQLPGDPRMILDCFLGSGTTGCAAVEMERQFIGIEANEVFFDIACKRIEDAQRQVRLFV